MGAIITRLLSLPPIYRWLTTLALIALIIVLSVTPGERETHDSVFVWLVWITPMLMQKSLHAVAYATLTLLWVWTLEHIESRPYRLALAFALSMSLGIALEWYQTLVPGRFGVLFDILLNGIGALAGLAAAPHRRDRG